MRFPKIVSDDDMPLCMKEWELAGFVIDNPRACLGDAAKSFPVRWRGRKCIEVWKSDLVTSYTESGTGHWVKDSEGGTYSWEIALKEAEDALPAKG